MARTEAAKESQRKYSKKIRQVMVKFNMDTEGKILRYLESQDNMQAYIKSLIVKDMAATKPERVTKYDLIKASIEVRKEKDIKEGCTFGDEYPEVIEQFDNREDALAALAKFHSSYRELSSHGMRYYDVTEYSVEENIYDKDGDFVEHESIIEYSTF